ncbi:MAG: hypothetical protein HKP44_03610 [Desulfofustis sp.]|nr:hypothetical protein [Desulfofustis sp.]
MDFKDQWDLDTALKIVQNKTVDSKLWAEAVEWLLLYGPPEVVSILLQASGHATEQVFPELEAASYSSDGAPVYDVARLAEKLGLSEDEIRQIIKAKSSSNQMTHFIYDGSSETIH